MPYHYLGFLEETALALACLETLCKNAKNHRVILSAHSSNGYVRYQNAKEGQGGPELDHQCE